MRSLLGCLTVVLLTYTVAWPAAGAEVDLQCVVRFELGSPVGQLRAVPLQLDGGRTGLLVVYSQDAEVDPYEEMFFFPKDALHLAAFTLDGQKLWQRDLGRGVVPGIWFCPVFPFDLDGDGVDEIWLVNNADDDHPLGLSKRKLERMDARTGRVLGQTPWPAPARDQSPSHTYRNFILGGHAGGRPVLVTAQGTYGAMKLQGFNADLTQRWEHAIAKTSPGARGSHMCSVVDLDGDGVDEVFWGERCIELDGGRELFCADRDKYRGHSDVVQPTWDEAGRTWSIYTCRESGESPRVVLFDARGQRLWSDLEQGHIDMGWTARLGEHGEKRAMAIRIGGKSAGPQGFARKGVEEFTYDVANGKRIDLGFSVYGTLPVDVNGDAIHELVRGLSDGDGSVIDRTGRRVGQVEGRVAMVGKLLDRPGEHIVSATPDGTVRIWADLQAADTPAAQARYKHRFYQANRRLTATGYNLMNLGGL